ncbi:unnamed protein product, partial [Mesorhabditis spiculigera]
MLTSLPYTILDQVIQLLDRDDVGNCRQVNRGLRRFIDTNRHHYPLPPITLEISIDGIFRTGVKITKTSDWTGAKQIVILSQMRDLNIDSMWKEFLRMVGIDEGELEDEENDTDEEESQPEAGQSAEPKRNAGNALIFAQFFGDDDDKKPKLLNVSSISDSIGSLFTGIFSRFFVTTLKISEVPDEIFAGIVLAEVQKVRQLVSRLEIEMRDSQEIGSILELISYTRPYELKFQAIEIRDIEKVLTLPIVAECSSIDFDLDTDDIPTATRTEVFLQLKCAHLNLPITTTLDSTTLNFILKEWVTKKRDFKDLEAWELFGTANFDPAIVFDGVPCQKYTARSPRASMPSTIYYKISRGYEFLTVFVKGTALLINHPIEYMLSIGAMFPG